MENRDGVIILETETDIAFKEHFDGIVESYTKDIIRLNEKVDQLEFELKAADFDYQKQIKRLRDGICDAINGEMDSNKYVRLTNLLNEVSGD